MDLKTALEHHLAGRLLEAETLYQHILQVDPGNSDALYFSGVLARQQGKLSLAADLIAKAINASASNPMYYNTLGNVFKEMGRSDCGCRCYRQGLACKPDYIEALFNLGSVLQLQYKTKEAVDCYHRVLRIKPDYAEAHNDLGVALMAQFRWEEAAASLRQALVFKPGYAEACNNLGVAFKNLGRMEEAEACYRQATCFKTGICAGLA